MNTWMLYLVNRLFPLLPDTRLYALRAKLWRRAGIDISSSARLTATVRIMGRFQLSIGADTFVGHETLIVGGDAPIKIGANCDIGPRVMIVNGSHALGHRSNSTRAAGEGISEPISIGDGAWIGAGSTILGGVRIGNRAVVGAGSVVTSDISEDTVAVGIPCQPIKRWNSSSREWEMWQSSHSVLHGRVVTARDHKNPIIENV